MKPTSRRLPPSTLLPQPTEKKVTCPICGQRAKAGGPQDNYWIIQPHSPDGNPVKRCEKGIGQKIKVSP